MGTSRTCLLFLTLQLTSIITAQEMVKRVPTGFVGMRGKKYMDEENPDQLYKRKPQFFVGVKGKKSIYDLLDSSEETIKRAAPVGFVGMRGKKEMYSNLYSEDLEYPKRDGSLIGQIDYSANEIPNEPYPFLNQLLSEYLLKAERPHEVEQSEINEANEITNEIGKRANIHQFFGVRGKKSIEIKRPYDLTFRGKFIGVRGKKDLKNSGTQEIKFLVDNGPLPKRKGQMGFIGMRGKKWSDDMSSEMESPN